MQVGWLLSVFCLSVRAARLWLQRSLTHTFDYSIIILNPVWLSFSYSHTALDASSCVFCADSLKTYRLYPLLSLFISSVRQNERCEHFMSGLYGFDSKHTEYIDKSKCTQLPWIAQVFMSCPSSSAINCRILMPKDMFACHCCVHLCVVAFGLVLSCVSCALPSHVLWKIPWQEQCFGLGAFQPTSGPGMTGRGTEVND